MKRIFVLYILSIIGLFFYSYTQIDLGLVITRVPFLYAIERWFQYIGYFNRPLSTILYIVLMVLLTSFYIVFLREFGKKKLKARFFWKIILLTSILLAFSYNAFSYDLFNYIFDAKIVTHYAQNPYVHKALDFPADPMLGFMHWTTRTYPYGPVWLGLTIPLSFIGANYFILTFYLFKLLIVGSYVGTVYFLVKIGETLQFKNPLFQALLFACNPLVLIESTVSAHNDIVMMFLALWALYCLVEKKYIWAFILLFLSIGIKFATVFLLPIFLFVLWKRQQQVSWGRICYSLLLMMIIPLFFVISRTNFQPWYLLYLLPFVSLIPEYKKIQWIIICLSIVSLGVYLPFLYLGNWNTPWYTVQTTIYLWLSVIGIFLGFLLPLWEKVRMSGKS